LSNKLLKEFLPLADEAVGREVVAAIAAVFAGQS
jgi:hypothetical protein